MDLCVKFSLPKVGTAPFCPPEVAGSVAVDPDASFFKRVLRFAGPGLLVSIGYMDPGNWATAIEAGSRFGYSLLFVVLLASLAGMVVQCLCSRLGIATGRDLAQLSRERYSTRTARTQWLLAEISIIATDLAEVLGCALAFHLLLGCSLTFGIALTAFDTLLVLALQNRGFRRLEAIMLVLVATIGACFFVELLLIKPYWPDVARGFTPSLSAIGDAAPLYLAIGILGATVMPHNLYLHTSIVQTRLIGKDLASKQDAVQLARIDTIGSLALALLVNAAILILAAAAFHQTGHTDVVDIQDAYHLLDPLVGGALASVLFGVALLASGQSSTFTGTIAGQVIMEGFLEPADSLLATAFDHPRAGTDPGVHWRVADGRRCHRQVAGAQSGGAESAVAVCLVPADPDDQRSQAHGAVREPVADAGAGVGVVCGDQRGEQLVDPAVSGLSDSKLVPPVSNGSLVLAMNPHALSR